MERQLPPGLSDAQRCVLLDFFDGRLPAGQLTERLGIAASSGAGVSPGGDSSGRRLATRSRGHEPGAAQILDTRRAAA
jgi:hypothetical protein